MSLASPSQSVGCLHLACVCFAQKWNVSRNSLAVVAGRTAASPMSSHLPGAVDRRKARRERTELEVREVVGCSAHYVERCRCSMLVRGYSRLTTVLETDRPIRARCHQASVGRTFCILQFRETPSGSTIGLIQNFMNIHRGLRIGAATPKKRLCVGSDCGGRPY